MECHSVTVLPLPKGGRGGFQGSDSETPLEEKKEKKGKINELQA